MGGRGRSANIKIWKEPVSQLTSSPSAALFIFIPIRGEVSLLCVCFCHSLISFGEGNESCFWKILNHGITDQRCHLLREGLLDPFN